MNHFIPYNQKLKKIAQDLRRHSTIPEILLWKFLKNKQLVGTDFNRQKPLGNYIVDFYSSKHKLAIELDGTSHDLKEVYDEKRQNILAGHGIKILRFTNEEVRNNIDGVLVIIRKWISKNTSACGHSSLKEEKR